MVTGMSNNLRFVLFMSPFYRVGIGPAADALASV